MIKEKARKVGRPRMPKGQAKGRIVPVRVTPDWLRNVETTAKANNNTVSETIRKGIGTMRFIEIGSRDEEPDARAQIFVRQWEKDGWKAHDRVEFAKGRWILRFLKQS